MSVAKIISALAVIGAVATAVAAQVGELNPRWGTLLLLIAAVAAAAGGALNKFSGQSYAVTLVGLVVAVTGALAGFADFIGAGASQIVAIVGTAVAAAGKALWPESPEGN